jgi:FixJ family two-component response regulator
MGKKPVSKETINETIDRGLSNTCRITLAEDALENQNKRIDMSMSRLCDLSERIRGIERAITQTTREPEILKRLELLEKQMKCTKNGHKWKYEAKGKIVRKMFGSFTPYFDDVLIYDVVRICSVCGKSEAVEMPNGLLHKIKKLFKD